MFGCVVINWDFFVLFLFFNRPLWWLTELLWPSSLCIHNAQCCTFVWNGHAVVSLRLLVQSADFIILFPSVKLAPLSLSFLWLLLVLRYFARTNVSRGDKIATATGIESERSDTNCHFQLESVFVVYRVWWLKKKKKLHGKNSAAIIYSDITSGLYVSMGELITE